MEVKASNNGMDLLPDNEIKFFPETDKERTNKTLDFLSHTAYTKSLNKTETSIPDYSVMEGAWLFEAASNFHFNDHDIVNLETEEVLVTIDKTGDGDLDGEDLVTNFNAFVLEMEEGVGYMANVIDAVIESESATEVTLKTTIYKGPINTTNQALNYPTTNYYFMDADTALIRLFDEDLHNHFGSWHLPPGDPNKDCWFWVSNVMMGYPACVDYVDSSDHDFDTIVWRAAIANGNPWDPTFYASDFETFHKGRVAYAKIYLANMANSMPQIQPDYIAKFTCVADTQYSVTSLQQVNNNAPFACQRPDPPVLGHQMVNARYPTIAKMNFYATYTY